MYGEKGKLWRRFGSRSVIRGENRKIVPGGDGNLLHSTSNGIVAAIDQSCPNCN